MSNSLALEGRVSRGRRRTPSASPLVTQTSLHGRSETTMTWRYAAPRRRAPQADPDLSSDP